MPNQRTPQKESSAKPTAWLLKYGLREAIATTAQPMNYGLRKADSASSASVKWTPHEGKCLSTFGKIKFLQSEMPCRRLHEINIHRSQMPRSRLNE